MTVDPMDALNGFEQALNARKIQVQSGEIDSSVRVHFDCPDGSTPRFTYALTKRVGNFSHGKTKVTAVAVLVADEPHNGLGCFHASYATAKDERHQGLATKILRAALAELRHGMSRNGIKKFYVEAVIDEGNVASQRVADAVLLGEKRRRDDEHGSKVFHYMKLLG